MLFDVQLRVLLRLCIFHMSMIEGRSDGMAVNVSFCLGRRITTAHVCSYHSSVSSIFNVLEHRESFYLHFPTFCDTPLLLHFGYSSLLLLASTFHFLHMEPHPSCPVAAIVILSMLSLCSLYADQTRLHTGGS
ncbi:hypothetical protein BDQ94DRAFT_49323 [Aspergillus welwitschiae]|uniref:Uncharacterized protein n=3 Tax=Aspergillus TaxID=5052 RepID=A0A3F3QIX7_9EURO|nr:uncharacterized protein BO96DRAFT_233967 [Aspergillus niger CBS 101883]XP_026631921.1 hypothetical protein BDQ94DRAFT_49323 [Aspergillus welwitschiae]RDH18412.1 hypothetical protein M747DRAFT_76660 [Aspergillus niger ATCC 13496]RDK48128.1 hypothetical protein M752DRAFT_10958 [Aspergillus phoenicis ATCC 13157]PYH59129.1 hypothetical protein BO96DRAFT_233967 [Aspergillus niger CBS 101883]RDH38899.1 hypothetical protein BDQ94DRAFT_49323 [Aspergillus welwitschiae]